jgi:hypothetical protein
MFNTNDFTNHSVCEEKKDFLQINYSSFRSSMPIYQHNRLPGTTSEC